MEEILNVIRELRQLAKGATISDELRRMLKYARKRYKYIRIEYNNSHVFYSLKKGSYAPYAYKIKVRDAFLIIYTQEEDAKGKQGHKEVFPLNAIVRINFFK